MVRVLKVSGFRAEGLGISVWGSGFRVQGLGFKVEGLGFRVWGFGIGVSGLGFRASGLKFRVWGFGFRESRLLSAFPGLVTERQFREALIKHDSSCKARQRM